MTEAVRLTGDGAAFLSPTREFDEPGLEEGDWPRDLDGPETQQMLRHWLISRTTPAPASTASDASTASRTQPNPSSTRSTSCSVKHAAGSGPSTGIPGAETQAATPYSSRAGLPGRASGHPPDSSARKDRARSRRRDTARHPKRDHGSRFGSLIGYAPRCEDAPRRVDGSGSLRDLAARPRKAGPARGLES